MRRENWMPRAGVGCPVFPESTHSFSWIGACVHCFGVWRFEVRTVCRVVCSSPRVTRFFLAPCTLLSSVSFWQTSCTLWP